MNPATRSNAGVALLETLIALAILGSAGLGVVALLRQAIDAQHAALAFEQHVRSADRVLTAMVLLRREEFDQRLGRHTVGEFVVDVQRPQPGLYRLAVGDTTTNEPLLVTVVHRGVEE